MDSSFDLQLLRGTAKKTGEEGLEMVLGCVPEPLLSNSNAGAHVYFTSFISVRHCAQRSMGIMSFILTTQLVINSDYS